MALLETEERPAYQQIVEEAEHLRRLGLTNTKIARLTCPPFLDQSHEGGFVGRSAREAVRRAVKVDPVGRGPGRWTARAVQVRDEDGRKGAFPPPCR